MVIGDKIFNNGDKVFHKRLKKYGVFIKYVDSNICIINIEGIDKKVNIAFLE